MSTTIDQLETPQVLVDRERLLANIDRVQQTAKRHGVQLRPHAKTHKCIEIAKLQIEHGAVGLTASKGDEGLVFIESGVTRSITVAYPIIDPRKLRRLVEAAEHHSVDLRIVVDSAAGYETARDSGAPIGVFLKIDVGLHRCGIQEGAAELIELATRICDARNLDFRGLLSHAGHAYASAKPAHVANDERELLLRERDRLEAAGVQAREISVGSTPTVLAAKSFDGITEIRPGNYVFLDATAMRLRIAAREEIALSVLATIISANDRYFIIDAGSKVLSSDLGAHGSGGDVGYGLAFQPDAPDVEPLRVVKLSEEHGFVERGEDKLPLGTKLRIIPNHACPVANLAERLTIVSGDEVVDQWPVAARGKVR